MLSLLRQQLHHLNPFSVARGRRWPDFQSSLPWYDQPDALQRLQAMAEEKQLASESVQLLEKWIVDGYVILNSQLDHDLIDRMCADVDALWFADAPFPDLQVEEVRVNAKDTPGMSHEKLLQLPVEVRQRLRANERWRVHGFYRYSEATRDVYNSEEVRSVCSLLFDQPAIPHYSINFIYGSRQELHQDTAVFHVFPANHLIGAWIACEDVTPESGPLVFYPGSHRVGLYEKFDNYPQTNLRTCSLLTTHQYNSQLANAASDFERHQFLAKKGDVLLWNGLLIHGGDAIKDASRTRKSFVTHFIPQGMDRSQEVSGPFNWG